MKDMLVSIDSHKYDYKCGLQRTCTFCTSIFLLAKSAFLFYLSHVRHNISNFNKILDCSANGSQIFSSFLVSHIPINMELTTETDERNRINSQRSETDRESESIMSKNPNLFSSGKDVLDDDIIESTMNSTSSTIKSLKPLKNTDNNAPINHNNYF
jgi:hypothetical protein